MKKYLCFFFIVLFFQGCGVLSDQNSRFVKTKAGFNDLGHRLATDIQTRMQKCPNESFAYILVDSNKIISSGGFGYQDKSSGKMVTEDTVFCLGSVAKVFTGIAIMQLEEKGLLSLDDPVSRYIPEMQLKSRYPGDNPNRSITLRHILTHRSGLPADRQFEKFSGIPEDFRSTAVFLSNRFVQFPAGTYFSYCNAGFSLLGLVIERVSGQDFYTYMHKNIFQPLQMHHSSFLMTPDLKKTMVTSHIAMFRFVEPSVYDSPAGSLLSTPRDMARFVQCILNQGELDGKRILNKDTLSRMMTAQPSPLLDFGLKMGLSWHLEWPELNYHGTILQHGGGTITFFSMLGILPEEELGVVTFANGIKCSSLPRTIAEKSLRLALETHKRQTKFLKNQNTRPEFIIPPIPSSYAVQGGWMTLLSNQNRLELHLISAENRKYELIPRKGGVFSLRNTADGSLDARLIGFLSSQGTVYLINQLGGYFFSAGYSLPAYPDLSAWKKRTGHYIQAEIQTVRDNPVFEKLINHTKSRMTLFIREERLFLSIHIPQQPPFLNLLIPVSDNEAIIAGMGDRNSGVTLHFYQDDLQPGLEFLGMKYRRK